MLEAANANAHLKTLHLGIISSNGLETVAQYLKDNTTLNKLEFQENDKLPWTEQAKLSFCTAL